MAGINLDSGDYLFRNITKTKQGEKISEQGFLIAGFPQSGFLPVLGMGWVIWIFVIFNSGPSSHI